MKIDVGKLLDDAPGAIAEHQLDDTLPLPDRGEAVAQGTVRLNRLDRSVLAHFDITANVNLNCDKCLESFRHQLPLSFDREYLLAPSIDPEALFVDGKILDTDPAVAQEILISLPLQAVCKPDCQGLCQECGINLNTTNCEHLINGGTTEEKNQQD
ncbi:MAG: DUF177 domain-containing protein [bacterium]